MPKVGPIDADLEVWIEQHKRANVPVFCSATEGGILTTGKRACRGDVSSWLVSPAPESRMLPSGDLCDEHILQFITAMKRVGEDYTTISKDEALARKAQAWTVMPLLPL